MRPSLTASLALLLTITSSAVHAFPTATATRTSSPDTLHDNNNHHQNLVVRTQVPSPQPTTFQQPQRRDDDDFNISIPEPSIPSLDLDLPSDTCHPTIKPGKDGYVPPTECNALWQYFPSFAAAIAFCVLFGILLVAHLGQAFYHGSGYAWVVVMAAVWEAGSYASRAAGSKNQQSEAWATLAQILVLLSPLWVNAFAYMVFARVVNFFSPNKKVWVITPSMLALVFVTLDFVSFIIQLVGGGMAGPGGDPKTQKKGINIYMGGIGMQEGFIVIFLALIVKFHLDMIRADRSGMLSGDKKRWRPLMYTLYVCLLAISVRIIFRLIEFSGGEGLDNPLPNTESYFYALDGAPMWIAILVWNLVHPGRYMQGPDAKMPPGISKYLCCCCRGRKNKVGGDGLGPHKRLDDPPVDDFNELRSLRGADAVATQQQQHYGGWAQQSQYQQPEQRNDELYAHSQYPRGRPTGYNSAWVPSRDVSAEPPSYGGRNGQQTYGY